MTKPKRRQKKNRKRKVRLQKYNCASDGKLCAGECREANLFRKRTDPEMICPSAFSVENKT